MSSSGGPDRQALCLIGAFGFPHQAGIPECPSTFGSHINLGDHPERILLRWNVFPVSTNIEGNLDGH